MALSREELSEEELFRMALSQDSGRGFESVNEIMADKKKWSMGDGTATDADKAAFWAAAKEQNPDAFGVVDPNWDGVKPTQGYGFNQDSLQDRWDYFQSKQDPNTLDGALLGEDLALNRDKPMPTTESLTHDYTNNAISTVGRENVFDPNRGFVDLGVAYQYTLDKDGNLIPSGQTGTEEGDVIYHIGTNGNLGQYGAPVTDTKVSGPDGVKGMLASPIADIAASTVPVFGNLALAGIRDASGITQHSGDWISAGLSAYTDKFGADWVADLAGTDAIKSLGLSAKNAKKVSELLIKTGMQTAARGGDIGAALKSVAFSEGLDLAAGALKSLEGKITDAFTSGGVDPFDIDVGALDPETLEGLQDYIDQGTLPAPSGVDINGLQDYLDLGQIPAPSTPVTPTSTLPLTADSPPNLNGIEEVIVTAPRVNPLELNLEEIFGGVISDFGTDPIVPPSIEIDPSTVEDDEKSLSERAYRFLLAQLLGGGSGAGAGAGMGGTGGTGGANDLLPPVDYVDIEDIYSSPYAKTSENRESLQNLAKSGKLSSSDDFEKLMKLIGRGTE